MSSEAIIFLLGMLSFVLAGTAAYYKAACRRGIQRQIQVLTEELKKILDSQEGGGVKVFTDNRQLMELAGQINKCLEEKGKTERKFMYLEDSYRKMLSNISHDIKTPMTVLMGYLEIMEIRSPVKDENLMKAQKKAQDVMNLIHEFFTLAKLEAKDTDLELKKTDLSECVKENVLDFYEILSQKGFDVDVKLPKESVYVLGNKEALQRIFYNLISNAVRYGADGKYLGVFLRQDGSDVYVEIKDKGKGIEKDFADRVFDRLVTLEDSRNKEIQGNGLGLTIAKNLAECMNGDLTLDSVPQVSTVFTLRLPALLFQSDERNS